MTGAASTVIYAVVLLRERVAVDEMTTAPTSAASAAVAELTR